MRNYKALALVLAVVLVLSLAACGSSSSAAPATTTTTTTTTAAPAVEAKEARTYYLCSSHQAHPYFADSHLALRYAAEYFGVTIVAAGPEGWDTKAQAESIEQAIAKNPNGIITRMWDDSPAEAVKKAMDKGIPVVITETRTEVNPGLTYIGLDNYQCGRDTAAELVKVAGESGKLVCMGNWGASNTDAKLKGVKEYMAENYPGWEIIAEVDDKAATADAVEAAKSVFNNYPQVTAIIGLDSSTGTGVSLAMEELNIPAGTVHIVVHDREASTLEYIKAGYIDSTMINKTATDEYLAILLMEDWNDGGLKNIPISSDNVKAGINPVPENMYNTAAVINASNVDLFMADNMPEFKTDLYNY